MKKEFHKQVFDNQSTQIPLCVNVASNPSPYNLYEAMRAPQKAIENSVNGYINTIQVQSDIVPIIENNFLENLIPSIFGAQTYEGTSGLIDVKPIFSSIYETENILINDIFVGEMVNAIIHLEYLKNNAPEYLYVNPSRVMTPLDYAVVMRGGDFYMELAIEPELSNLFMDKIADVTIKVIKEFKKLINQPLDEYATPRGLIYPGIRLTGDAVVNLSPTMIKEIMCPQYKRFEKEFSKVMLHYCCLPAPSTHVLPALIEGGGVSCVDNWQGYKTLLKEADYTQTSIGVCTDISSEQIMSEELVSEDFFKTKGRPLAASVGVKTCDEGKYVYDKWQQLFSKR